MVSRIATGYVCRNNNEVFNVIESKFKNKLEVNIDHLSDRIYKWDIKKVCSADKNITEFNIGHFLVSESLFIGLATSVKKYKKINRRKLGKILV